MEKGLRHTMCNLGDIFVDKLECMWGNTKESTRGIKLTYNIRQLKNKKKDAEIKICKRVLEIREKDPGHEIFKDEELSALFIEIASINYDLDTNIKERDERLYPAEEAVGSRYA